MNASLPRIAISLASQRLIFSDESGPICDYAISSALNGPGEQRDSLCTPRGLHQVRARIGAGLPAGAVLAGRRPTGEVWSPELHARFPDRDWILSRILWLSGKEPGRNRLGDVDTMQRYIYIHGAPPVATMGAPGSHGCIRMHNDDVIELFERVPIGTLVEIFDEDAAQ